MKATYMLPIAGDYHVSDAEYRRRRPIQGTSGFWQVEDGKTLRWIFTRMSSFTNKAANAR